MPSAEILTPSAKCQSIPQMTSFLHKTSFLQKTSFLHKRCNYVGFTRNTVQKISNTEHTVFILNIGIPYLLTILALECFILLPVDMSKICMHGKQCRPRSDAASAASDLGLHCLQMCVYPKN